MSDLQLFKIAVSAFIVRDGRLLLLKRGEDETFLPGTWEVPGGGVDQDETIEQGVIRETMEEAGIEISVGRVFGYFEYLDGRGQKTVNLNFLCEMTNVQEEADTSAGEMAEARWVAAEEFDAVRFTSGEMRDACRRALEFGSRL